MRRADTARCMRTLNARRAEQRRLDAEIPTTMVMAEDGKPRDTFVLGRGDYRNQRRKVTPGVPAVLPPLAEGRATESSGAGQVAGGSGASADRARGGESLLADVFRDRHGEDRRKFRLAGRPAVAIRNCWTGWRRSSCGRGWDVKAMQRLIVTSATYRQSSKVTPEMRERDPENRLLARGPRFRLPAEMVRDNALAVSGLLNEQDRRTGRVPVSAKGLVGRDRVRRRVFCADCMCRATARICTAAACTRSGSAPARRLR